MDIMSSDELRCRSHENLLNNADVQYCLLAIENRINEAMKVGLVDCIIHLSYIPVEYLDAIKSLYLARGYNFKYKSVDVPRVKSDDVDGEMEFYLVKINWKFELSN